MHKIERNIQKIELPFLTMHGTDDKVVDIASSHFLMEHAPSKDKTMKVFTQTKLNTIWLVIFEGLKIWGLKI